MAKNRQKPPFWRRGASGRKYDIELLRPAALLRGKRFETLADARQESERSEQLLRSFSGGLNGYQLALDLLGGPRHYVFCEDLRIRHGQATEDHNRIEKIG